MSAEPTSHPDLPVSSEGVGQERTYTWNGLTHTISYPQWSDVEMAGAVRMLMRYDLNHEGIVVGARDRIMCLAAENKRLLAALEHAVSLQPLDDSCESWVPAARAAISHASRSEPTP